MRRHRRPVYRSSTGKDDEHELYGVFGQNSLDDDLMNVIRKQHQRCAFCFTPTKKLLNCSGCLSSWYCSKACQTQDYKAGHKALCPILRKDCDASLKLAKQMTPVGEGHEPEFIDKAVGDWIVNNLSNLHIIAHALCSENPATAKSWNSYVGLVSSRSPSTGQIKLYFNHVYRIHRKDDPLAFSDDYFLDGRWQTVKPDSKYHHYLFVSVNKSDRFQIMPLLIDRMQCLTLPPSMSIEKFIILLNAGSLYSAVNLITSFGLPRMTFEYQLIGARGEWNKTMTIVHNQFMALLGNVEASDRDRRVYQKLVDHVHTLDATTPWRYEHDSVNGYPIPAPYIDGVGNIFAGMASMKSADLDPAKNHNKMLKCSPEMYKRLEELLTDMTIGSQRDRTILAMPMLLMAPNGPFHYASRHIIGKCKLNGVTIPKCYEGCVASLCQEAEHATDDNTSPIQPPRLVQ